MPKSPIKILASFALLCSFALQYQNAHAQFYDGSNQEFGKNRVQYKKFDWFYYPTEYVDVYFYNGGKELAEYAAEYVETALLEVQTKLDYSLQDKPQIIVYNSQTDFRQSNIGIQDDTQENVGGKIPFVGSKVFVYFEGDHELFSHQIRENLSRIVIQQMMYGGNWKSVLRSSAFLHMPEWYIEGLVSYLGDSWNSEKAKFIRDGVRSQTYTSFNELTGDHVKYAGHAFWKFISEVYGETVIPNILYMTKISRNIEDGFLFVLGKNVEDIFKEYEEYWQKKIQIEDSKHQKIEVNRLYTESQLKMIEEWKEIDQIKFSELQQKFENASTDPNSKDYLKLKNLVENWDQLGFEGKKWRKLNRKFEKYLGAIPVKVKKKYDYSQFKRSPDGEHISFVTHEYGQYKIWLYHISSGKLKRLVKRESKIDRIQDESYPKTSWHPSGESIGFISEKRGRVYINSYDLNENKNTAKELFRIDKVIAMDYSSDGKKIVFSAMAQGQNDLFMYYVIGNNQTRLTNDIYDDLDPRFIPGTESIIFSSNRPDDTLRVDVPVGVYSNMKDIYILKTEGQKELEQITRTPGLSEEQPYALTDKYFTYLTFKDNFRNQFAASVDSVISRIDTTIHYRYFTKESRLSDFAEQLDNYDINTELKSYGYTFYKNGKARYNWGKIDEQGEISEVNTSDEVLNDEADLSDYEQFLTEEVTPKEKEVDPYDYVFGNSKKDYEYEKEIIRIGEFEEHDETAASEAEKKFELPKSRNYRLNFTLDELTTQVDNSLNFDMYRSLSSNFTINQGSGLGGMAKGSDLFEDYKFKGIARVNFNRSNSEVGILFSDISKRLDKHYALMRYSRQELDLQSLSQIQQVLATYKLNYPINELYSIRSTVLGLLDENKTFATDINTVARETRRDMLLGGRFSLVFDNTRQKAFNLLEGTRYKVFAEYYKEPFRAGSDFKTIGLDFRHYENLFRDLTLAVRAAGVVSFGSRRLLNALGGVDSELFAQQADPQPTISADDNYYYFSQSTQVRGFRQVSRIGNNFGLANVELRWPVVRFFSKKPLSSEFAQTFQLQGFFDIGSAWNGNNPYSEANDFNQLTYEANPVSVTVLNNREPLIWSYGAGARAKILGYFVRADIAWGVDDGFLQDPIIHITFVQDF